ncbi:MAG: glycerol kinase GlpK [Candidatus Dormibacteraeota bacterium]|nr:glycerol kinase GlpK [Candidatus Dormibacteraeota bacterium]MBO0704610.1 glycerol kinase GlpK [Candidatus Dormibacteraeota bacterium]MBO0760180.1 glycerol kinase GlpK [Candidatus Dormibacteraeota bacterium]
MPTYAAAIDQGTTGTRFMVFDHGGRVVSSDYLEHEQIYPQPGWVEHDAVEIWTRTQAVIRGAMEKAHIAPEDLAAIGITNQRETAVVWEKDTGKPVYNAIVWQDTRTRDQVQQLIDDGFEPTIKERTGLVAATYFSGTKVSWILENVAGVRERAERGEVLFGNIDTWVIWLLTGGTHGGVHVTDYTNASRTMLMNLHTLDWDDEMLRRLRIPRAMLPEIRPSSDPNLYGRSLNEGPVRGQVAVCGDLGDQQAAVFGQTCYDVGEAKNTYGTGNFMLLNTGRQAIPSKSGLLTTAAYGLEPGECTYALEGSIAITGAAVQWLRDNLGLISNAAETEGLASSVSDTGGCYFVPAFSGLFAPYWDMYARGAIVGLSRYVDRRHLARATLEATCYQTKDVAEAMEADSGVPVRSLKVDGGMTTNDFLLQLQADVLGITVVRPTVSETTALGASYAAGLAVGFWSSLDELRKNWQVDRTWHPAWSAEQREEGYRQWKKAVERTRNWIDTEARAPA